MDWIEKYRPRSLDDIIGQEKQLLAIKRWLRTPPEEREKLLILSGPPGCGKTSIAHLVLAKYEVEEYNPSNNFDEKEKKGTKKNGEKRPVEPPGKRIATILEESIKRRSILDIFAGRQENTRALIFDDVDGISERGSIGEFTTFLKANSIPIPIICTCGDAGSKSLKGLLALGLVVKLQRPSPFHLARLMRKIVEEEGLVQTEEEGERILEAANRDMRQLITIMQTGIRTTIASRDVEVHQYDSVRRILCDSSLTMEDTIRVTYGDQYISLLVHQNYPQLIDSFDTHWKIMDGFIEEDWMQSELFKSQDWRLALYGSIGSSYRVNTLVAGQGRAVTMASSEILNKNKLASTNTNKGLELRAKLNLSDTELTLLAEHLTFTIFDTKQLALAIDYLDYYCVPISAIPAIICFNRYDSSKYSFTPKIKRDLIREILRKRITRYAPDHMDSLEKCVTVFVGKNRTVPESLPFEEYARNRILSKRLLD